MPAYFETGFSVREVPWHGLGKVLDEYPGSWDEAKILAGLDWEPEELPVYDIVELNADGTATVKVIDGWKQVKRNDTGLLLALAQDTYHLIPNQIMGEILETILDKSDGEVQYETAGSLHDGRRTWALARLGREREIPGDPSPMQPYIGLLNSHDGSAALRAIATGVRIVCANTWHAAEMDSSQRGSAYAFKHTSGWKDRVEEAKAALRLANAQIDYTIEEAKAQLQVHVNAIQRRKFIEQFAINRVIANTVGRRKFTKSQLEERLAKPRVQTALRTNMAELEKIIDSRTCEGIRDTAYGLIQAAGEWADHIREATSDETRLTRTMFADREPLKVTAVKLAREVVKTA